jgi:hypothetical protein
LLYQKILDFDSLCVLGGYLRPLRESLKFYPEAFALTKNLRFKIFFAYLAVLCTLRAKALRFLSFDLKAFESEFNPLTPSPPKILHVLLSMAMGGAETLVYNMVKHSSFSANKPDGVA